MMLKAAFDLSAIRLDTDTVCLVCGQPTDGPVICDECDSNFDQADGDE